MVIKSKGYLVLLGSETVSQDENQEKAFVFGRLTHSECKVSEKESEETSSLRESSSIDPVRSNEPNKERQHPSSASSYLENRSTKRWVPRLVRPRSVSDNDQRR